MGVLRSHLYSSANLCHVLYDVDVPVLGAASQGTITTNDYDSAENFGMYVVNGTSATNAVLDWGRLFVIPQTQTHCLQVKYAANARKIIIRYKYKTSSMPSPIWTEWSEVNVTAL